MKRKTAALYNPYLDTLGGGERYSLSILKVLEDEGYDVIVFWDKNISLQLKKRFNFKFRNLKFLKNIFTTKTNFIEKQKILAGLDILIYLTDGSYFISTATSNFVYAMVPKKELFSQDLKNKLILLNWQFITHSKFTQKFLSQWKINSEVLYPYLDENFVNSKLESKEKIILTVGRFFTHLHAKKHDKIIKLFKKNKGKFPEFKLILAGGLKKEDQQYFDYLKKIARGDRSIEFKTNISFDELLALYRKSMIYWHFAGFGIDENKNPELVEHFGLTPLEAMASGCIVFIYNAGGPRELIQNGKNGFLFDSEKDLINKTLRVMQDETLQKTIRIAARRFVKKDFGYNFFRDNVMKVLKLNK